MPYAGWIRVRFLFRKKKREDEKRWSISAVNKAEREEKKVKKAMIRVCNSWTKKKISLKVRTQFNDDNVLWMQTANSFQCLRIDKAL